MSIGNSQVLRALSAFCLAIVALASTGCGTKLTLANARSVKLNQTTGAELKSTFGEPDGTKRVTDDNGVTEIRTHHYSGGTAIVMVKIVDLRFAAFEVHNEKLVGFVYWGTQGENATAFDAAVASRIAKGMTRDQVRAALGEPHGKAGPKTKLEDFKDIVPANSSEVWIYTAVDKATSLVWESMKVRALTVGFDARGVVVGTAELSINGW